MCLQSPGKTDVYTYNDFFHGIMDDVLPPGAGPNLLLGYLHRWYVNLGSWVFSKCILVGCYWTDFEYWCGKWFLCMDFTKKCLKKEILDRSTHLIKNMALYTIGSHVILRRPKSGVNPPPPPPNWGIFVPRLSFLIVPIYHLIDMGNISPPSEVFLIVPIYHLIRNQGNIYYIVT